MKICAESQNAVTIGQK